MKKFMIKSLVIIMMCAIVFSYAAVTVSATDFLIYSYTYGNYFSCNLKGDIVGTSGAFRSMAKTTRRPGGDDYAYVYAKAYLDYPDGTTYSAWDTSSLDTITVKTERAVSNIIPCGVSSYHLIHNGSIGAVGAMDSPGNWTLGYQAE